MIYGFFIVPLIPLFRLIGIKFGITTPTKGISFSTEPIHKIYTPIIHTHQPQVGLDIKNTQKLQVLFWF